MRKKQIAIFFSVFFSIYALINFYIYIRGYEGLEYYPELRIGYIILFLSVSLSYFAGRFFEKRNVWLVSDVFIWIGSFWFAFILYFFFSIILIDLIRLANIFGHFLPSGESYAELKFFVTIALIAFISFLLFIAYLNAKKIRIKTLELPINKQNEIAKKLTIAVASDIHLGTIIGRKRTKRIVDAINSLNPDIILLPGDIVDGDVEPVIKLNLGEVLRQLKSNYGIYAITGNHEYIGGVEPSVKYISEHGIRVLRDEVIDIAGMTIIGREDRSINGFAGKIRKSLIDLSEGIDHVKPVIVMDHQPFHLEESEGIGADLQLSGHTHHAQLWPLNFITKKIYEISWGYKKKGNTHIYVSCGVGTWGPPTRLGSVSEIIEIRLKFL
jgi:predicted MPP superfamily phosphohydrolase